IAECFLNTENGFKGSVDHVADFLIDRIIRLVKQVPPFGVPYNHIFTTAIEQHRTRYFAGEGSLTGPADVLGSQLDWRSLQKLGSTAESGKGWTNHNIDLPVAIQLLTQLLNQLLSFRAGLMHLPVSTNQRFSSHPSVLVGENFNSGQ